MSKPEPLKDKWEWSDQLDKNKVTPVCREEYIKSAVEWLKEQIKTPYDDVQCNEVDLFELIDKAFEDVVKENAKTT